MSVFKTYDIRGIYKRGIDRDLAYLVGRAFARHLSLANCVVAYDAREYSNDLCDRLIDGLLAEGVQITAMGLTSTPHLHHVLVQSGFEGGVMVTASHNPPRYHGFKIFGPGGDSIGYDTGLSKIEKIVESLRPDPMVGPKPGGKVTRVTDIEPYITFLASAAKGDLTRLKVVVDASNGSAGGVFRALVHRLGLKAWIINGTPDGFFPNHGPNPLEEESRQQIAEQVVKAGADLGALLDGDGDRVIFVDETGRAIENYFVSALIAEELLAAQPGAAVVYDLISSRVLPERIEQAGGKPIVSRVGYGFIHDNMVQNDAIFGTETSGHVYFRAADGHFTESAGYALVMLLNLMIARGGPLSEMVQPMRTRFAQAPELNVEVEDREAAMRRVEEAHHDAVTGHMDGISVEYDDHWFNIRPSNTEPILRLRLEATNTEVANARSKEIMDLIQS